MSHAYMESRAEAYLALRRRLGSAMKIQGELLLGFARYADGAGHQGPITTALALHWAKLPQNASPGYWAGRLGVVRGFARYEAAHDPRTEVPPYRLLGRSRRRVQPHIYSDDEIADLLGASAALSPMGGLRPRTYTTFFGLLAATGLRVSEAIRLAQADVDLLGGVLRVCETKFHKSRLVPLHPSTTRALGAYIEERDRRFPRPQAKTFFLSGRGLPLSYGRVRMTFVELRHALGWVSRGGRCAPRIYDIRHTFACRRLLAWYEEGGDINLRLPVLATYLGHVQVSDTYWYLTAIPDLMAVAGARFEREGAGQV